MIHVWRVKNKTTGEPYILEDFWTALIKAKHLCALGFVVEIL